MPTSFPTSKETKTFGRCKLNLGRAQTFPQESGSLKPKRHGYKLTRWEIMGCLEKPAI